MELTRICATSSLNAYESSAQMQSIVGHCAKAFPSYEQGLLSVIEFKKQMTMIKTYDEISTQLARYEAEVEMKFNKKERHLMCSFAEWIQPQLLQQTPCTTLLELLEQMLKEENEALGKAGFYEQYKRETHANQKYCLAIVKQMIEARQPVA